MKITRLYLKNFAHIFGGMNKYEIDLDFRKNDKVINILIGKMGSGKTALLGQLQPFASFGTLDERNQDALILEGENGLKIIEYLDGINGYKITHQYTWVKDHHTVKSFIEKNGEELNENGNQSSFKTIVEYEFGIDQNFLKLIRLGPNVANLINLKDSERKAFIATMLQSAEIYSILYKGFSSELRTLNSQIHVILNKLNALSADKIEDIENEYEDLVNMLEEISKSNYEISDQIHQLQVENNYILKDMHYESYLSKLNAIKVEMEDRLASIESMEEKLKETEGQNLSIFEISKIIGSLETEKANLLNQLMEYDVKYQEYLNEYNSLNEKKKIIDNQDHINTLKKSYNELLSSIATYETELKGFHTDLSYGTVKSLFDQVENINQMIVEIIVYPREAIKFLYNSDSSVLSFARKKIEMLTGRKVNIQKSLNNIKFADKYESPIILYRPPNCPTDTCPYVRTHPETIKKKKDTVEVDAAYQSILDQVEAIDREIAVYSDYPVLYNKIHALKCVWGDVSKNVSKAHALIHGNLYEVLLHGEKRKWYSYDKLMHNLELLEKREKYYELLDNVNAMKAELQSYEIYDTENIDSKIEELRKLVSDTYDFLDKSNQRVKEIEVEQVKYNEIYTLLTQKDAIEKRLSSDKTKYLSLQDQYTTMSNNKLKVESNRSQILELKQKLDFGTSNFRDKENRIGKLKALINDIKYAKEEYQYTIEKQENLKLMVDAVSSSKGIPVILIKFFLNNCKDIVNELIQDVFKDSIEILDFDISETTFKIPFMRNGIKISDISSASQGQRSIISLALSFALIRQATSHYNVLLLDEMDGPLYKDDRNKFINILFNQIKAINAEQIFLISHNNTFDGHSVNIIMTTEEQVDNSNLITIMRV